MRAAGLLGQTYAEQPMCPKPLHQNILSHVLSRLSPAEHLPHSISHTPPPTHDLPNSTSDRASLAVRFRQTTSDRPPPIEQLTCGAEQSKVNISRTRNRSPRGFHTTPSGCNEQTNPQYTFAIRDRQSIPLYTVTMQYKSRSHSSFHHDRRIPQHTYTMQYKAESIRLHRSQRRRPELPVQ